MLSYQFFEDRNYELIGENRHWKYDDFVKGRIPSNVSRANRKCKDTQRLESAESSLKLKVLVQGKSDKVDKLFSWLVRLE